MILKLSLELLELLEDSAYVEMARVLTRCALEYLKVGLYRSSVHLMSGCGVP